MTSSSALNKLKFDTSTVHNAKKLLGKNCKIVKSKASYSCNYNHPAWSKDIDIEYEKLGLTLTFSKDYNPKFCGFLKRSRLLEIQISSSSAISVNSNIKSMSDTAEIIKVFGNKYYRTENFDNYYINYGYNDLSFEINPGFFLVSIIIDSWTIKATEE